MDILKNLEVKTLEAVRNFKDQLAGIRGGRPSSKLVEDIQVEYFGQKMSIKQLGSINVLPPREIQISTWDKQVVSIIAKAIETALSVSVNTEGNLLRVNLPALSNERRQEIIKLVKKEAEEAKIRIRSIRDDANKEIGRQFDDKKIGEDEKFNLKEKVQKSVDKANEEIENVLGAKIKEIEE